MKSDKLDKAILEKLAKFPGAAKVYKKITKDEEFLSLYELANVVSVRRMGFNDHGITHVKIVVDSSLKILDLLGMETSLVKDKQGSLEDSVTAIILGALFHDIGMTINRKDHEMISMIIARPIMERILGKMENKARIIATASEAILCHMAHFKPTSVEAGIVSIADGTDMTMGRARIPHMLGNQRGGRIHSYSALSILNVKLGEGESKPVRLEVNMKNSAGIFQVEEIMLPKLENSGLADKFEVIAVIKESNEVLKIH